MGDALKKTGAGNLFVVFGEPDLKLPAAAAGRSRSRASTSSTHDGRDPPSATRDDIACWFIDTDYDGESFFVRHAYFLNGRATSPTRAEKDAAGRDRRGGVGELYRTVPAVHDAPASGKIAVKVINHYGDEVLKVYRGARVSGAWRSKPSKPVGDAKMFTSGRTPFSR